MVPVASIVEGDGEVSALPVLLRRLSQWLTPEVPSAVLPPIRVYKDRFLNRPAEFSRHLQLAALKSGDAGWVLILLDADDDCPMEKGRDILAKAREIVPYRRVATVLANREYESWFIAAAGSLQGVRGFRCDGKDLQADAETPRNAKKWMGMRMDGGSYGETTDQAAFSARMDLPTAYDRSRSFRKLCDEWKRKTSPSERHP